MIGKSDIVIILVSGTVLIGGIVRWQLNLADMARPASPVARQTQVTAPATANQTNNVVANSTPSVNATSQNSVVTPANTNVANPVGTNATQTGNANNSSAQTALPTPASSDTNASTEPLYGTYIVKSGDYLSKIAVTYGTTVATLQRINKINGTVIDVNQRILYPLPAN